MNRSASLLQLWNNNFGDVGICGVPVTLGTDRHAAKIAGSLPEVPVAVNRHALQATD